MADTYVKISELPAASAANPTDQLEANQAGTSRSITAGQITAGYLPLTGGTLTGDLHGGYANFGFVGAGFAGTASVGWAGMNAGDASHPGYIQFVRADSTRLGYIGFNDGRVSYNADAGFFHEFTTGNVVMNGALTVSGLQNNGSFTLAGDMSINSSNPSLVFGSTTNAVDQKRWRYWQYVDGSMYLSALADSGTLQTQFQWTRTGDFGAANLITAFNFNATGAYQIAGVTVLSQGLPGFTTLCNAATGATGLFIGGPSDQSNFHRNTSHYFQSLDGSLAYLTLNNTIAYFYVPIHAPTADAASNDERVATTRFVKAAVEAALGDIRQRLDALEQET